MPGNNNRINVQMAFSADTSQVKAQLKDLETSLKNVVKLPGKTDETIFGDLGIKEASKAAMELQQHLKNAMNVKTGNLDLSKLSTNFKNAGTGLDNYYQKLMKAGTVGQQAFTNLAHSIASAEAPTARMNARMEDFLQQLKTSAKWQLSNAVIRGFSTTIQGAYQYAEDLNKSLNNIRIVTGKSVDEMSQFAREANAAAKALSVTTTAYTDASLIFYQQGLTGDEVTKRTETVLKLSNVTGDAAQEVSSYMTAIWNNYAEGADNLEHFADVITALGATTASSSAEIAAGLEKFAAIGETVGLSYEYATSALAAVVAKTRQSADVVGTAFKTLFARLQGLQLGDTLEDGVTLNKYSQALATVGVQVVDLNGNLRNADAILEDTASKWDSLTEAQKTALAQTVAGTRQYSQFVALMEAWDDVQNNLATANNSDGSLQAQADIYAESWEGARKRVKAAWQGVYDSLIDEDFFISIDNGLVTIIEGINGVVKALGGMKGIATTIGSILLNVFAKNVPNALNSIKTNFLTLFQNVGKADGKWQNSDLNPKNQMLKMQNQSVEAIEKYRDDNRLSGSVKAELTGAAEVTRAKVKLAQMSKQMSQEDIAKYETEIQYYEILNKEHIKLQQIAEEEEANNKKVQRNAQVILEGQENKQKYEEKQLALLEEELEKEKEILKVQQESYLAEAKRNKEAQQEKVKNLKTKNEQADKDYKEKINKIEEPTLRENIDINKVRSNFEKSQYFKLAKEKGKSNDGLNKEFRSMVENALGGNEKYIGELAKNYGGTSLSSSVTKKMHDEVISGSSEFWANLKAQVDKYNREIDASNKKEKESFEKKNNQITEEYLKQHNQRLKDIDDEKKALEELIQKEKEAAEIAKKGPQDSDLNNVEGRKQEKKEQAQQNYDTAKESFNKNKGKLAAFNVLHSEVLPDSEFYDELNGGKLPTNTDEIKKLIEKYKTDIAAYQNWLKAKEPELEEELNNLLDISDLEVDEKNSNIDSVVDNIRNKIEALNEKLNALQDDQNGNISILGTAAKDSQSAENDAYKANYNGSHEPEVPTISPELSKMKGSEAFSRIVAGAMAATTAMNALNNTVEVFMDDSASLSQIIGAVTGALSSLVYAIPTIIDMFGKLKAADMMALGGFGIAIAAVATALSIAFGWIEKNRKAKEEEARANKEAAAATRELADAALDTYEAYKKGEAGINDFITAIDELKKSSDSAIDGLDEQAIRIAKLTGNYELLKDAIESTSKTSLEAEKNAAKGEMEAITEGLGGWWDYDFSVSTAGAATYSDIKTLVENLSEDTRLAYSGLTIGTTGYDDRKILIDGINEALSGLYRDDGNKYYIEDENIRDSEAANLRALYRELNTEDYQKYQAAKDTYNETAKSLALFGIDKEKLSTSSDIELKKQQDEIEKAYYQNLGISAGNATQEQKDDIKNTILDLFQDAGGNAAKWANKQDTNDLRDKVNALALENANTPGAGFSNVTEYLKSKGISASDIKNADLDTLADMYEFLSAAAEEGSKWEKVDFDEYNAKVIRPRVVEENLSNTNSVIDALSSGKDLDEDQQNALKALEQEYEKLGQIRDKNSKEYINSLIAIREALEEEKHQIELTQKQELVDELDIDVHANPDEFESTLEKILDKDYEILVEVKADIQDDFDTAVSKMEEIQAAAGMIGEGYKVAAKDVEELNDVFPGILDNAEFLTDGTVKLNKEIADSAIATSDAEIKADIDATIQKLEDQKIQAEGERDTALAIANIAKLANEGKINSEKAAAQIKGKLENAEAENSSEVAKQESNDAINVANTTLQAMVDMSNGAKSAYKEMTDNSAEWARIAQSNAQAAFTKGAEILNSGNGEWVGGSFDSTTSAAPTESEKAYITTNYDDVAGINWQEVYDSATAQAKAWDEVVNNTSGKIAELLARSEVDLDSNVSGKGNGKDKNKDHEDPNEDKIDRYHDLNRALKAVENEMKIINKLQDGSSGATLIAYLNKQNALLEKQRECYEAIRQEKLKEAGELQGKLASFGATFDSESLEITNYADTWNKIKGIYDNKIAEYNLAVDAYNEMGAEEQKSTGDTMLKNAKNVLDAAKKDYDLAMKYLEQYDKTLDDINDEEEKQLESLKSQIENNLKTFEATIKVDLDISEATRKVNDFLKKTSQDFKKLFKSTKEWNDIFTTAIDNANTYTNANGTINTDLKALNEVKAIIDNPNYNYLSEDSLFTDRSKAIEKFKELEEQLMDDGEALYDLYESAWSDYLSAIDESIDQFDTIIDQFDDIEDALDHARKINELLYGGGDTANGRTQLNSLYEASLQNSLAKQGGLGQEIEALAKEREELLAAGSAETDEDIKKIDDAIKNANKELTSEIENYLQTLQSKLSNSIAILMDTADKALTKGMGMNKVSERWQDARDAAEGYYDEVERVYQLETMESKWEDLRNSAKLAKNQQLITGLMDAQLTSLREKTKLSEYDIGLAEKELAIVQAQIALEEAQNNKNAMKLVRNEQGNWSYQYVADDENVKDKEQDLLDANYDKYEYVKNASNEATKAVMELYQTAQEKLTAIMEEYKVADETRRAELQEEYDYFYNYYFGEDGLIVQKVADANAMQKDLNEATYETLWALYTVDEENYALMTENEKALIDDMRNFGLDTFRDLLEKIATNEDSVYHTLENTCNEVCAESKSEWQLLAENIIADWDSDPESVKNVIDSVYDHFINETVADYDAAIAVSEEKSKTSWTNIQQATKNAGDQIDIASGQLEYFVNGNHINDLSEMRKKVAEIGDKWYVVSDAINSAAKQMASILPLLKEAADTDWNPDKVTEQVSSFENHIADVIDNLPTGTNDRTGSITPRTSGDNKTAYVLYDTNGEQIYSSTSKWELEKYITAQQGRSSKGNLDNYTIKEEDISGKDIQTVDPFNYNKKNYSTNTQKNDYIDNIVAALQNTIDKSLIYKTIKKAYAESDYDNVKDFIDSLSPTVKNLMSSEVEVDSFIEDAWKAIVGLDTGGYTGDWSGGDGRIAMLHSKELVLNKEDTMNILSAVGAIRDIATFGSNITSTIAGGIASMIGSMLNIPSSGLGNTTNTTNETSNVFNIQADFPNASNAEEIREALMSLPTLASQYLSQNKR